MTEESPISPAAVRTAITRTVPDASVIDVHAIRRGKNAVYKIALRGDTQDELVMKIGTATARRITQESNVLAAVASSTSLPVPGVVETVSADDPANPLAAPYLLMEAIPGRTYETTSTGLPPQVLERVCYEAGKNLGTLHRAFVPDGVGPLEATGGGLIAARPADEWPSLFQQVLRSQVGSLEGSRFDHLLADIDRAADRAVEALRDGRPYDPVMTHMDYRFENLKLRTDGRPVTAGILDWGGAAAAPPEYELAHTEAILLDRPALTGGRKATLERRFYDGYAETGARPVPPGGTPFDYYRLAARLRLMKNIDAEMEHLPKGTTEARAREHIDGIRRLLDDL